MATTTSVVELLLAHEGYRERAYLDTRGNLTVGIGFNLDAPGARSMCAECGLDYAALRGGAALSMEEARGVAAAQAQAAVHVLHILVGGFGDAPERARMAMVDMVFNVGAGKFAGFRAMINAAERRDWDAAAAAMLDSEWARQVPQRAQADAELMRSAALPAQQSLA